MFLDLSSFRSRGSCRARFRRQGFSLIEVALALMVVAVGLLSVFGVFPVSLRSSQMARSDLSGSAFASSLLQTIGGNIRGIDDIRIWKAAPGTRTSGSSPRRTTRRPFLVRPGSS